MANNSSNVPNPYTSKIPSGTLNNVQLTNPQNVAIQWPSISGNTVPKKKTVGKGFFRAIFG
jgi:hypothetical protein